MTDAVPTTMRAVRQLGYGDADRWVLGDEPVSTPGPGRVLVRVEAAGVDQGTWHLLTGKPYLLRLVFGVRAPKRVVPGFDLAGRVVAIGEGVARFAVGDEVFGIGEGSYAEYATALESKLERRPACWTATQAAAVPVSGLTAWQALHEAATVEAGQRVLVIGASGGVGSFAVQIAVAAGARVTAVCSGAKAEFVRGLGAEQVVDHRVHDVADLGVAYDLVLDIGGRSTLRRLRRLTVPGGTVLLIGGDDKNPVFGPFGRSLRALAWTPFAGRSFVMLVAREHHSGLRELAGLGSAGKLTPAVDRVFPLADAVGAITALAAGTVRGKLVLSVGPGTMTP
ncbi:MAG TPA: NAD(P)-dependent alcohol dehydrogenase [Microlunatus sp.]